MKRSEPFKGKCRILPQSGLRKRMRAARRKNLPAEVLQSIKLATSEKALMRHAWYRRKKAWDALRHALGQEAA